MVTSEATPLRAGPIGAGVESAAGMAEGENGSSNGGGEIREDVMAKLRQSVRELALAGLSAQEIESRLDDPRLTDTEREILRRVAEQAAEGAH